MSDSPYPICEHVKDNGERCGSPALRGQHICYFHDKAKNSSTLPGRPGYRAPLIECAESIQITVAHVNQSLLDGTIDAKTANVIFRGLSLVKSTLADTRKRIPHQTTSMIASPNSNDREIQSSTTAGADSKIPPRPARFVLSASELANVRKIIRQGPRHPDFARCSRILDAHIASRSTA